MLSEFLVARWVPRQARKPRQIEHGARRLGEMTIRFDGNVLEFGKVDNVWFSVPDLKRRLVPARVGVWLPTIESACDSLADGKVDVEISVGGEGAEPTTTRVQLEPEFIEAYGAACRRLQG